MEELMLRALYAYLDRGWSPFPLLARDKRPIGPWNQFRATRATPAQLDSWAEQGFNIGLATGLLSGVMVVDADGPEAIYWMDEMLARDDAPLQPVVRTPGGGAHYYFQMPPSGESWTLGNRAKLVSFPGGDAIDIRAEGGYVVMPPSSHPSGGTYEWMESTWETTPPMLPLWLLELLTPAWSNAAPEDLPSSSGYGSRSTGTIAERYVQRAVDGSISDLRSAAKSTRNDTLFRSAVRLYELQVTAPELLTETEIDDRLEEAAADYIADDGAKAFERTIKSAKRRAQPVRIPGLDEYRMGARA